MNKIIDSIIKYPVAFFIGSLILFASFSVFAPFVKTVDNVDYFTLDNDPNIDIYNEIKTVFGNDEFFVIAFEKETIFTAQNLKLLVKITEEIQSLEEVRDIKSLANVDDTMGGEDYFEVRKFIDKIPEDDIKLSLLKEKAINNPMYVNNLISKNGKTAAIVVYAYERPDDESYRKVLMDKCMEILRQNGVSDTEFWVAGWTSTNLYLSQYLKDDMALFIPLVYLLISISVFAFFRNMWLTLLAVLNISVCMGSTMGLFYLCGITLNNVTTIVPPLIMALALCDTVHIFASMEKKLLSRFKDKQGAISHILKSIFLPCFLTTFTTAIGFISLGVSDLPPIREFAFMGSAGMVFEFLFSFFFLVPLILFFPPEKIFISNEKQKNSSIYLESIVAFIKKNAKGIVVAATFIVVASAWFATSIRIETNLLDFFKETSPVRQSLSHIEERLSGIATLDISLRAKEPDAFIEPKNLLIMEDIQAYITAQPGVDVTLSFVDFLKDINESFHNENKAYFKIPEAKDLIAQYMLLYDSEDIEEFINSDYSHGRISVRLHEYSSAAQKKLVLKIKDYIAGMEKNDLEIIVSGRAVNDVNTIDALVNGQVSSMLLASSIIFGAIFLALRSFSIGLLSFIPNIFPVAINFGIMGALGIPLNTATSLISAVAIGIAVDDTIHFLFEYKTQRVSGMSINLSVERTIYKKGWAILTSSLILCIGFGVMIFSRFIPIVNFGSLSAVIMITALIGDLIVLPAVLCLYDEKKSNSIETVTR